MISLEFADPASGLRGWIGSGHPGLADGESAVALFKGADVLAAGRTTGIALARDGTSASAQGELDGTAVKIALGPTADTDPLRGGRATVEIDSGGELRSFESAGALITFDDASQGEGVCRSLVAMQDDGSSLGIVSAANGAGNHGDERTEAWLLDPEGTELVAVEEPLLSTQYDGDGDQMRAGLELWVSHSDQVPLRGAGTRVCGTTVELDGWKLQAAFLAWTVEGIGGAGSYMIWRPS